MQYTTLKLGGQVLSNTTGCVAMSANWSQKSIQISFVKALFVKHCINAVFDQYIPVFQESDKFRIPKLLKIESRVLKIPNINKII